MSELIITLDTDWACEAAIEETLSFLLNRGITPTVFTTHHSPVIEAMMGQIEVGLHPFFHPDSSHGATVDEVVRHVLELPHNLPAYRCHRFATCNTSQQAMVEAGMLLSSNVCTDLEVVAPFKNRFGILEVPIFLEDGGYLWSEHPLTVNLDLYNRVMGDGVKVLLIHPMHFVLNTPHFEYMKSIKKSYNRKQWSQMTKKMLDQHRWSGRGIRDLLVDIIKLTPYRATIGGIMEKIGTFSVKERSHHEHQPQ